MTTQPTGASAAVPGLVQGDGLAIAHRVAHDDRENGDEG